MRTSVLRGVICVASLLLVVDSELTAGDLSVELRTVSRGFDGLSCRVHARAAHVPAEARGREGRQPQFVMTFQNLSVAGSDDFTGLSETVSEDGVVWSKARSLPAFGRVTYRGDQDAAAINQQYGRQVDDLLRAGDETTVCDFVPAWHAGSQRLLGTGQTVWYRDGKVLHRRPRGIAYAVRSPATGQWATWKILRLPDLPEFRNAGAGSSQRYDLPGGDILLPFSCRLPEARKHSVVVCRCRFDGETLHYVSHGNALTVEIERGLYEPSLIFDGDRFLMTMRNDRAAWYSVSRDGLHFDPPQQWKFDDGRLPESYNTQQHWLSCGGRLYLVYTRRGLQNDHVFRHRAPLLTAEVDRRTLFLRRDTEQVLVPERGARLGNFGVTRISDNVSCITVTEWMQPAGVGAFGADNSLFSAVVTQGSPFGEIPDTRNLAADRALDGYAVPPPGFEAADSSLTDLLKFHSGGLVDSAADWQRRRVEIRTLWDQAMGMLPEPVSELQPIVKESRAYETWTEFTVEFQWAPGQRTRGYLLIPQGKGPFPGVLSVFYEPETAVGRGKPHRDYARRLVQQGFVCLSLGTTEASADGTYAVYHPSLERAEVQPLAMLAYVADSGRRLLAERDDVDSSRIGIVGHSFGGKWAMFAACLFDEFACGVWSDPGIRLEEHRPSVNYWEPWYLGYHQPPWRRRGLITALNPASGAYPGLRADGRNLHELLSLMAPRPFLVSGGSEDPIGRWKVLNHCRAVNDLLGAEKTVLMTNRPEHSPNADNNRLVDAFFRRHLKVGSVVRN